MSNTQHKKCKNREGFLCPGLGNISTEISSLPSTSPVMALHFSPADRALIYCITMTICPNLGHRSLIMMMITGRNLEFSHNFITLLNMNCFLNEFIVMDNAGEHIFF
ncbi:MAG: hypothetical protein HGB33_10105 [Syntrophaceae bacterium]|nr:hypothetical protein [Syntrophaceae bacterium]